MIVDIGDQIAPTSPKASKRAVHVSEKIDMDPILHHQVLSLPKEAFKLTNSDFICPICFEVLKEPFITRTDDGNSFRMYPLLCCHASTHVIMNLQSYMILFVT